METTAKSEHGVVIHPQVAQLILTLNKKLHEAQDTLNELKDLLYKEEDLK